MGRQARVDNLTRVLDAQPNLLDVIGNYDADFITPVSANVMRHASCAAAAA